MSEFFLIFLKDSVVMGILGFSMSAKTKSNLSWCFTGVASELTSSKLHRTLWGDQWKWITNVKMSRKTLREVILVWLISYIIITNVSPCLDKWIFPNSFNILEDKQDKILSLLLWYVTCSISPVKSLWWTISTNVHRWTIIFNKPFFFLCLVTVQQKLPLVPGQI